MTAPATQRTLCGLVAAALLSMGLAACGQRGPLTLPNDARPIERLEAPPAETDDETDDEADDDERANER